MAPGCFLSCEGHTTWTVQQGTRVPENLAMNALTELTSSPLVAGLEIARAPTAEPAKSTWKLRPRVKGKFFFIGEEKWYIRGVTYGTFRPNEEGEEFPAREVVERDFAQMVANGVNAVRTYTPPPLWLAEFPVMVVLLMVTVDDGLLT